MSRPETFRQFLSDYEQYIENVLKPEHQKLKRLFEKWRAPYYWAKYVDGTGTSAYPSPIKSIFTRIKRPEKVIDKILRKPQEYPDGISSKSFHKMHDCIGVRIIVYFLSQLPYIDRELRQSKFLEVSETLPPEAYLSEDLLRRFGVSHIQRKEKESGYNSIHYVVRLKQECSQTPDTPWVEVQVRTMAQELWSEMEHILAYKSEKRTNFSAKKRLQILSREINAVDEHFNLLYEELIHNQEKKEPEENETLNSENLSQTLSMIGIRCALQDFDTILSILHSRGVNTIKELVNLASPKRLETIKNTYVSVLGRPPDGFELIASLGSLKGVENTESVTGHVTSQIEFSRFWNKFRKKMLKKNDNVPRSYE